MLPEAQHFLRRWFEEQLRFTLPDGTDAETVFVGGTECTPTRVLQFDDHMYNDEFNNWLNEKWRPQQQYLRQEILGYSANAGRYHDLTIATKLKHVVPFVGSGMSVLSGLPTWATFLRRISAFATCEKSEVEQLLSCSDFEGAADLLFNHMTGNLFDERVEQDLRITNPGAIAGSVCVLPSLFPKLVVTTNLDNVLEIVYRMCGLDFGNPLLGKRIAEYYRLRGSQERFLLKLHGDHRSQQDRVLLPKEYDDAYASGGQPREMLTNLFYQRSLLFLGCSLGPDRTVGLLKEAASHHGNAPKHYAFLEKPNSHEGWLHRENELAQSNIFPIWYDTPHDEAIMALLEGLQQTGNE